MLHHLAMEQGDNLENRLVDRQRLLARRRLVDEGANLMDDAAGAIAVLNDTIERPPERLQIWRLGSQPAQSGLGIGDGDADGLVWLCLDPTGRTNPRKGVEKIAFSILIFRDKSGTINSARPKNFARSYMATITKRSLQARFCAATAARKPLYHGRPGGVRKIRQKMCITKCLMPG